MTIPQVLMFLIMFAMLAPGIIFHGSYPVRHNAIWATVKFLAIGYVLWLGGFWM